MSKETDFDALPLEINETRKMLTEARYAELITAEKERDDLRQQLANSREEIADMQKTFDMQWDAIQRGIKMWQERTGCTKTWPDQGSLVAWLLSEIDRLGGSDAKPE